MTQANSFTAELSERRPRNDKSPSCMSSRALTVIALSPPKFAGTSPFGLTTVM